MSIVKNLNRMYSEFSVQISEWSIQDRQVTVLWGASGSGKTTVVRSLSGIDILPHMQWQWGNIDKAQLAPHKREVGVVLQHYGLFPHLTAKENIFFPIEAQGRDRKVAQNLFEKWTAFLSIQEILERKAHVLSGGEQQRVALARALITQPQYLILDEPFSALDHELKQAARQLLKNILKEEQIGVLLVTHDREDVAALAHEVVILQKGRIIATQTTEDFLKVT